ncbi:MAG: SMC family ATPase [Dehalococcoidales bacterium]
MIPARLKMRNFMCYRDNVPPLDFTGIHLACLSGDNGNGKSAIIDAMTWALWGKARAASDDELIYTSQPEMEVEFDFAVGQQLYRIIRKRSRPKKKSGAGQSSLEFQIKAGNDFRPITGNTIAQTQQKIIETLHMDYDTFINSAYLRQGHADEFTSQAPAKRKEVLGNILGLARYDELEDRAKSLVKQYEAEIALTESSLQEIHGELSRKPECEAELEKAQTALNVIEAVIKENDAALDELRRKKESLESKRAQLEELEIRLAGSARDLQRWEEQAGQHLSRIKTYEEVIGRRAEIETGYAKFTGVKKAVEELDRKERQAHGLERQKMQFEAKVEKARNALTTEHTVAQREIARLEARASTLPALKDQLNQAQARRRKLADTEAALRQKEQAVQEAQKQVSYLESERVRLEKEIGEVGEKLDLIASHIASHTEARCPLCNSELTREGLALIAAKYTREKEAKADSLIANRDNLAHKRAEFEALSREKVELEAILKQENARIQSQEELGKSKIREIEEESLKLAEHRSALSDIEQRLARRDFAAAEQQAMGAIERELAGLDYAPARHDEARRQLQQLESCERDKNSLDEALRLIDREKETAEKAQQEAQSKRDSVKLDTEKKEGLAAELVGLPAARQELAAAEVGYKELTARRSQSQEALGSIKAQLQRLGELEIKQKEKEDLMARSAGEEALYRDLARAFGKTGIQALLIEVALPEIEAEANRLLARMTDNRMHVKFETQKETKRGTVQETLDISIADELGTRSYEMFSGGEAFRINFAVRIALSRLLARRAGAPLPTLIIDEGFGTQDSTGIEKLKEAITSIQDDFDKILVITHLEELKDAFPTRIDVTKTAEGSMFSVS